MTASDALAGVSRETVGLLKAFEVDFQRWASRVNLVSTSALEELWTRHILDSAQLVQLSQAKQWLDLGSGGGFPGLVVAILLKERGDAASVRMVESNRKKVAFLRSMIGQFRLPAEVLAERIEDAPSKVSVPEIVTARALAPLERLLSLSLPWLGGGATALFHKGENYQAELAEVADTWSFDLVEHPSLVDSQGVILQISNLVRK